MSLKCSLLGCDYGAPDHVEEREERENEVVVTTREVRRCDRCGNAQVLSENKEVTTVERATADEPADRDSPEVAATGDGSSVGDPWESIDETPNATEHIDSVGHESPDPDPGADDGVIIGDDGPGAPPSSEASGSEPAADRTDAAADGDEDGSPPEAEWADAASVRGVAQSTYSCPDCGFEATGDTSLRPGDVCPDCQVGYLEERSPD